MSIIKRIRHLFSALPVISVMAAILAGCVDDPMHESAKNRDAEVEIKGEVIYRPLVPMKVQTRADAPQGKDYKDIKSLYLFFFDSDKKLVKDYTGNIEDFTPVPSESSTHERVKFKKKVKAGEYYVYAVANIPYDKKGELEKVATIDELRNFKLDWNDDISKDLEMFGVFKQVNDKDSPIPGNEDFETDTPLNITPDNNNLLSWVRRAVSKVTVDFDGTNLKEGVTVYIKNAVLKNVASATLLGSLSKIGDDGIEIGTTNYSLTYGNGESYNVWPSVTNSKTSIMPSEIWEVNDMKSFHDDNANALPCYENLQGKTEGKTKYQDKNKDGKIDSEDYDGVPYGTYLEVEGYYVANSDDYKSQGEIIYRFMLGQNAVDDFNLLRNHHYKITMNFKGYGNDVDWHIEYSEQYFDVTIPEEVNYQGKFFVPDADYRISNGGHTFSNQNIVTVTSFKTDGKENEWVEPKIGYSYYKYDYDNNEWVKDDTGNWLTETPGELSGDKTQKQYTFVASKTDSLLVKMNELLSSQPPVSGSETSPYNLSNKNGGMNVENTANCYIVGAPGWYCFPLVYGNAITEGQPNGAAYASPNIVNHLNKNITNPYIKDNEGVNLDEDNVSVEIIWKDNQNIVKKVEHGGSLRYDGTLFNGKGGIKFYIDQGNITECNFVVALIDKNAGEDEFVRFIRDYWPYKYFKEWGAEDSLSGSTKAVWSWHIWVTRFGFEEFGRDIPVFNHEGKKFDVMPVNLGWCSGGREFRYYKPRKCVITFTVGEREIEREIVQYPHLLLPRGNHPYYQWGRKDPFVGTNQLWHNKHRWSTVVYPFGSEFDFSDTSSASNPPFLYYNAPKEDKYDNVHNEKRKNTKDCLDALIKNPDKWHNCKHGTTTTDPYASSLNYFTMNESPKDLWLYNGYKTVYDPCPSGYEVGSGVSPDSQQMGKTRRFRKSGTMCLKAIWNRIIMIMNRAMIKRSGQSIAMLLNSTQIRKNFNPSLSLSPATGIGTLWQK